MRVQYCIRVNAVLRSGEYSTVFRMQYCIQVNTELHSGEHRGMPDRGVPDGTFANFSGGTIPTSNEPFRLQLIRI